MKTQDGFSSKKKCFWLIPVLFVTILFLGCDQREAVVNLTCSIRSDKQVYESGETPVISVSIRNRGLESVMLIRNLDGSASNFRYPYCGFVVQKLEDPRYMTEPYLGCSNVDGLHRGDFVEIAPGDSFNPYLGTSTVYDDPDIAVVNFTQPGFYQITFKYSSESMKFGDYSALGDGEEVEEGAEDLFESLAHVQLQSDTLLIEVR